MLNEFYDFIRSYNTSVEIKSILPLAQDASSRKYFRVVTSGNSYILTHFTNFDEINIRTYVKSKKSLKPTKYSRPFIRYSSLQNSDNA